MENNTFGKVDLVAYMAEVNNTTKAEAERQLNAVLNGIESVVADMQDGDKFQLVGYFSFSVKHRPASVKRNPKTGESVNVEAHNVLKVKAGNHLSKLVR